MSESCHVSNKVMKGISQIQPTRYFYYKENKPIDLSHESFSAVRGKS